MGLDIRMPIGIMFTLLGLLLAVFGLVGDKAIYAKSLGINVNLGWGIVLVIFGAIMITLAIRGHRNAASAAPGDDSRSRRAGH